MTSPRRWPSPPSSQLGPAIADHSTRTSTPGVRPTPAWTTSGSAEKIAAHLGTGRGSALALCSSGSLPLRDRGREKAWQRRASRPFAQDRNRLVKIDDTINGYHTSSGQVSSVARMTAIIVANCIPYEFAGSGP